MAFGLVSLESRLKENIKNYSLDQLLDIEAVGDYFGRLSDVCDMQLLLADRHGEKAVSAGGFAGFQPNVVQNPGRKIRVAGRTIAHLYAKWETEGQEAGRNALADSIAVQLTRQAEGRYQYMETSLYTDELERLLEKEQYQAKHGEKLDVLTQTLNSTYFDSRIKVIDRSEVVPVAIICVNINDWKYADDYFGHEESDRLIKTVARLLKEQAKDEYVIARSGGDVFHVLIPLAEDGEAEEYAKRVQNACDSFEDDRLSPSVACGIVYKRNVEQTITELLPDAEYEMFSNKFEIKNAPGYQERLRRAEGVS